MLILIYGITGMVGHAVAKAALKAGHKVRGTSRNPEKLEKSILDRLESFVRMKDFYDISALDEAAKGVDAIISAGYYNPHSVVDGQILLLRAAERAGVKIFHASSWNNDWTKLSLGDSESYDSYIAFRNHARLSSPIKPIYAFTGVILEYIFLYSPHSNPIDRKGKSLYYVDNPDLSAAAISLDDLATYTLQAISEPDAAEGGCYFVDSFRYTSRTMKDAYKESRGVDLELKSWGSADEIDRKLAEARAKYPARKYLDIPEYTGLQYAALEARRKWCYESVDKEGRWSHIKTVGMKQWFDENPEV